MISERDYPVERAVNKVCAPHFQQDNTVPSDNVPLVCHPLASGQQETLWVHMGTGTKAGELYSIAKRRFA